MPIDAAEVDVDEVSVDEEDVDEVSVDEVDVDEVSVDEEDVDEVSVDEVDVDGEAVVSEELASGADVSDSGGRLVVGSCCCRRSTNAKGPADEERVSTEASASWATGVGSPGSLWPSSLPSDPCGTIPVDRCRYSLIGICDVTRMPLNRPLSSGSGFRSGKSARMAAVAPASAPAVRIALEMRFHQRPVEARQTPAFGFDSARGLPAGRADRLEGPRAE